MQSNMIFFKVTLYPHSKTVRLDFMTLNTISKAIKINFKYNVSSRSVMIIYLSQFLENIAFIKKNVFYKEFI